MVSERLNELVSFQLGGFYLWTSTYHLVKTSSLRLKALEQFKAPDHGSNGDLQTHLLNDQNGEQAHLRPASVSSTKTLQQVPRLKYTPIVCVV